MWIVIFALIVAGSILAIAIIPSLMEEGGNYKVTMTVEEFSIDLADLTQYDGAGTHTDVILKVKFNNGSTDVEKSITLYKNYVLNSGVKTPTNENGITFNTVVNPDSLKYSAFLCIERTYMDGPHPKTTTDIVDLYSVDTTKITGSSSYYGCSGVYFTAEDYSGDGSMVLKGDSDPIGYVKMTFRSVKI